MEDKSIVVIFYVGVILESIGCGFYINSIMSTIVTDCAVTALFLYYLKRHSRKQS